MNFNPALNWHPQSRPVPQQPAVRFGMGPDQLPLQDEDTLTLQAAARHRLHQAIVHAIQTRDVTPLRDTLNVIPQDQRTEVIRDSGILRHIAARINSASIMKTLLAAIPEEQRAGLIAQTDNLGENGFHRAAVGGDEATLRLLLAAVPDAAERTRLINQPSAETGKTPLHIAVNLTSNLAWFRRFLEEDVSASINHMDGVENGTPLQLLALVSMNNGEPSIKRRHLTLANMLIAHGANPNQLPQAFQTELAQLSAQYDQHRTQLVQQHATPEALVAAQPQVRESMRWFRQFPRGSAGRNWQAVVEQCVQFLQTQVECLNPVSLVRGERQSAIAVLGRSRPVVKSGVLRADVPAHRRLLDVLCKKAVEVGYWPAVTDTMAAGANHAVTGIALGQYLARQRREAARVQLES